MIPDVTEALRNKEPSQFEQALLEHVKALVSMSRRRMSDYYDQWDTNHQVYKGEREVDDADRKAQERGQPAKLVVPLSYAQIQTFIAFCFAIYHQKERMFELVGMGAEDELSAKVGEGLLERDLEYNRFDGLLYQFLLDTAKFSLGVMKTSWRREKSVMSRTETQEPLSVLGQELPSVPVQVTGEQVKYLGNVVENISPYRFFPDTRVSLSDFQKGEFVASESEMTYVTLKQLEHEGVVSGVDLIPKFSRKSFEERGATRTSNIEVATDTEGFGASSSQSRGMILVTEVQVRLIPSKFEVNGKPLGPEDYPIKYVVWYANDTKIIKAEPLGYVHDEFTYDVAQFNPDSHSQLGASLADMIDALQNVVTWFINSHITSVRKTIENRLVGVPSKIHMDDVIQNRPFIRMKEEAATAGVDRWLKQLDMRDVTSGHMNDAMSLQQLIQVVTGINENALGQFHGGRRSATEARNVNAAAAQRLRMVATLIFKTALRPMAEKMLSNLRDGLDEMTYVRVIGESGDPAQYEQFKKVSKEDLVGDYDFKVFDGTVPSDRDRQADVLQELVDRLISTPEILAVTRYDIDALIREVLELRGIRHPERFKLPAPMLGEEGVNQLVGQPNEVGGNGQLGAAAVRPGGPVQPSLPVGAQATAG